MSKSEGNNITPTQLFTGESEHISKAYSAMTLRFFFLQAHYSSTLDLNDASLGAAEKAYKRLMEAYVTLCKLTSTVPESTHPLAVEIKAGIQAAFDEMDDDFNAPKALARLFELCTTINKMTDGQLNVDDAGQNALDAVRKGFGDLLFTIFGLFDEATAMEKFQKWHSEHETQIKKRQEANRNTRGRRPIGPTRRPERRTEGGGAEA